MSTAQTLLLGAVAGFTIFVGLPMGRVRSTSAALRASLTAVATGILVFLFWDVVSHGSAPVETHLEAHAWGPFLGYAALLAFGFTAGMMSLVYYDSWLKNKRATPLVGPGAAAVDEFVHRSWFESLTPGAPAVAPDRDRHRAAQLRRGARDRPVGGRRRAVARARPDHRLRAPQRDRGLRHRRPDGG